MNANELMLGNLLFLTKDNFKTKKVYELFGFDIYKLDELSCQDVEPIPLTEKYLLDFGAETDRGVFRLPKLKGYFILLNLKGNLFYQYNIHQVEMCNIKYVHQLQNLYFSLTGSHLRLVEPK